MANLKRVVNETTKMLTSYLTYQAVRTIIEQLGETNPPLAIWFRQYASGDKLQDGDRFLQELLLDQKDLGLRVMTVREHLADSVVEFLPEMVRSQIQGQNMEYRRQLLERMTQVMDVSLDGSLNTSPTFEISDLSPPLLSDHPEVGRDESSGTDERV